MTTLKTGLRRKQNDAVCKDYYDYFTSWFKPHQANNNNVNGKEKERRLGEKLWQERGAA